MNKKSSHLIVAITIVTQPIWACSKSPLEPTHVQTSVVQASEPVVQTPPAPSVQTIDPVPTPVPPGSGETVTLGNGIVVRIAGPVRIPCLKMDRKALQNLKWNATLVNNPLQMHLQVGSFYDSKPGCEPTTDHPAAMFKVSKTDFAANSTETIAFEFQSNESLLQCSGRVQSDSIAINSNGSAHLITFMIDLGPVPASCAIPPLPPAPPLPIPPAPPTPTLEWIVVKACITQPDELEIRVHNPFSFPIDVYGKLFLKPDGGSAIQIAEVTPQTRIVAPDGWGGPEDRIRKYFPNFTSGVFFGFAEARTIEGGLISQFDLPETPITCPS